MSKKFFKYLKIVLAVLLSLVIVAGSYGYYFLNKSLPTLDGKIALANIDNNVKVLRDSNGIPTIITKSDEDLYKAQGFVQAQDRLFQMDLARRQASGRLSEVVGRKALENDKKFLTFSLRRAAEKTYNESYSEEAKKVLQYFADGVNEYIKYAKENGKLPYEFSLLGYEPEEWTPIDSVTISKYMAYDLGGHWDTQAFNNWILNNWGEEKLRELLPESFGDEKYTEEIIKANKEASLEVTQQLANMERPSPDNGSNNWAVSGSKTASGKPLIADDPHLSLSTPSIWYQMILKSDNVNVSGVIFAGIPGIILGHNDEVAWTVTNVGPDVQDLYIEKFNPENPHQYLYDGEWKNAEVVTHDIKIKDENSEKFELIYTHHGPVIDEIVKPINKDNKIKYSMRWTALEATKELDAILQINKAKDWQTFEKALENFNAPAQNFIYADNSGNIAFKANGNIPIRKKGTGNLPVPGYSSEYEWSGYIPYNELPKEVNPEKGYVASANTKTIENYEQHISNVWSQPYRMERIDEVLSQNKNDFTAEDMKKLQMDTKNLYAVEFLNDMIKNVGEENIPKEIYSELKKWDYYDDKNKIAPLVFDRWIRKTRVNLFAKNMTEEYKFMPNKEGLGDRVLRTVFSGEKSKIVEDLGGIKEVLRSSLNDALAEIENEQGKDISNWKWGEAHKLAFRHSLSSASSILAKILNPEEKPISGSRVTVQAASVKKDDGIVNHGASWRFVYDFNSKIGHHIVGPGQSGHFMSDYYDNQVANWRDGIYNEIKLNDNNVKHTLELVKK